MALRSLWGVVIKEFILKLKYFGNDIDIAIKIS